jgi:hypothetical protein
MVDRTKSFLSDWSVSKIYVNMKNFVDGLLAELENRSLAAFMAGREEVP